MLEGYVTLDSAVEKQRDDLLFTLYNNVAFCYLKRRDYSKVVFICKKALGLPSSNIAAGRSKLYYR